MSARTVRLGISPCPNDTFAFHGLLTGAVRARGLDLVIELADIEQLNAGFATGRFDAAKVSFAAALEWSATSVVLRAGSALGFGVGPLLLSRPDAAPLRLQDGVTATRGNQYAPESRTDGRDLPLRGENGAPRVLCPGEHTTAHLLYRLFHAGSGRIAQTVFSDILPALERGDADYGVCIHEGRFTYARHGLVLVEDLGATWERRFDAPLPLGGIVARSALGVETFASLDAAVRASLDCARADPVAALATMRAHAQELDDDVIRAHVDLYVNEWTRDLGPVGAQALRMLSRAARAAGLVADHLPELEVADAGAP
jgi:1,4-dihydroxy-6-naphthoate synthase